MAHLRLVPEEMDIEAWSFSFGHTLIIRAEKGSSILFDLRVCLGGFRRVASTGDINLLFSKMMPQFLERWNFESALDLRLYLGHDSYRGVGSDDREMRVYGETIFRRCKSVKRLHLYGISLVAYRAISDAYFVPPFSLHHSLPKLDQIFVVRSSFEVSWLYRSNWEYLSNILSVRGDKRGAVTQVEGIVIVDNLSSENCPALDNDLSLYFQHFPGLVSMIDKRRYHRDGHGPLECDACEAFDPWYETTVMDYWYPDNHDCGSFYARCDCVLQL